MVLVTGGTGILGMRICYDLLIQGEDLRILVRPGSDKELFHRVLEFYHEKEVGLLLQKVSWFSGDIMDVSSLEEAMVGCDKVIHSAAMVSFHPRDVQEMYRVNRIGTANVVHATVNKSCRLLYISSVAAIGRNESVSRIDETEQWKDGPMNSQYAISKYSAELEVWRGIEEGLDAVIVNPSIIIAAGDRSRSSGTVFGSVIGGNPFYTDGMATAVDVRDVSRIGLHLLNSQVRGERFIVHSEQISYRNLFFAIADALNLKRPRFKASKTLLSIAWRLAAFKDFVLRTKSPLTKETAMSARSDYDYITDKIRTELPASFIPVREAVDYHAKFYSTTL